MPLSTPSSPRPTRVLVVDDTALNVRILRLALESKGMEVLAASGGAEGLELAEREQPTIILLDLEMPEMDGFTVLGRLRAEPATKNIPVVILTAHRDPASIERGLSLGADGYLTKPIDGEELLARVRALVRMKQAEQALEELRRDFTSMLVHDLRSPLGNVALSLDMFASGAFGELSRGQNDRIGWMGDQIERCLTLINGLLDLSKLEDGHLELDRRPCEPEAHLRRLQSSLEPAAQKGGVGLRVALIPGTPPVDADPAQLDQMLMNLGANAVKFTPSGGSVTLAARPIDGGRTVELIVADTGIGISESEVPLIFSKYKQAGGGRSADFAGGRGTGLGLAIVKQIVEAHGATISVESIPGRGSAFRVRFPAARS